MSRLSLLCVCIVAACTLQPVCAQRAVSTGSATTEIADQENPAPPSDESPRGVTHSEESANVTTQEGEGQSGDKSKQKGKKQARGEFVIAPLPTVSPAIGSGIIPVVGYIFPLSRNDKESPPSTVGMAGMVTNNGTRGFAVGGQFFFKRNTYELTLGYAHGSLYYDLYGLGVIEANQGLKLPLRQTGQLFFIQASRRLFWKVFVGPRFAWGESFITVNPHGSDIPPLPPDTGLKTQLRSLGFRISRDTRQNHFYPIVGTKLEFTADFFAQALGSKYSFQRYQTSFNKFWGLSKNQVLAYDFYLCNTGGEPPFYGNCIFGNNNRLRGYTAGRYLDRHMFATQLEYRLSLPKRFGAAGFAGFGEVVPGATQFLRSKELLPDVGGGPRFVLSPRNHVNLRADFARGRGSWTWSVGVGEAF